MHWLIYWRERRLRQMQAKLAGLRAERAERQRQLDACLGWIGYRDECLQVLSRRIGELEERLRQDLGN